jgi:hypothetical protein
MCRACSTARRRNSPRKHHSIFANIEWCLCLSSPKTSTYPSNCSRRHAPPFLRPARGRSRYEPSEVHASVKRAQLSHLLHGPSLHNRPNFTALEEFLVHGLKYALPAEHRPITPGLPTSWAAKPLCGVISQNGEPPVLALPRRKPQGRIVLAAVQECAPRRHP